MITKNDPAGKKISKQTNKETNRRKKQYKVYNNRKKRKQLIEFSFFLNLRPGPLRLIASYSFLRDGRTPALGPPLTSLVCRLVRSSSAVLIL